MRSRVSDAVIRRMPCYYRYLVDLEKNGVERISSEKLGRYTGLTASQIRQDFNCFGGFGQQGYGYNVTDLKNTIAGILGLHKHYQVIIVGAGNVGQALANYTNFKDEGFTVAALFDTQSPPVGTFVNGVLVWPVEKMEAFVREHQVDIGIIATPQSVARKIAERMAEAGIKGIWNFAPVDVSLPEQDVCVENLHLSDSLLTLTYHLNEDPAKKE